MNSSRLRNSRLEPFDPR
jgi:Ca2+-binding EF-hand superfamily protein